MDKIMPSTCNPKGFQRNQYSPFKNTTKIIISDNNSENNDLIDNNKTIQNFRYDNIDDDDYQHHHHHHHNQHQNTYNNNNDNYHFEPDSDDVFISEFLIKDAQCQSILNPGEDDEMLITGYKRSIIRTIICWFFVILTGGLLRLILHWWRHWYLLATHIECRLDYAEKILIREDYQGKHQLYYVKDIITLNLDTLRKMESEKNKYAQYFPNDDTIDDKQFFLSVHFSSGNFLRTNEIRLFRCKQLRYIWDNQTLSFQKLQGLDINIPSIYLHQRKGLTKLEQNGRRLVYGKNEITIPIKGVITLLFLEALNPFYVFQIFSVCLWISYNYYYYAAVIVLMSAFGITMSIIQTKKNQDALRNTVQHSDCANVILDDGNVEHTVTDNLVPGDLIEIPSSGCLMHCDAVLLSGNCIIDESILTGESVPVTKTPLPMKRDLIFDKKEHSRHTLFCGTKVMQTRYIGSEKVLAIVINTGNITAKGGLIRSILYPPPVDYKFEQDSYKFITLLGVIAGIGFVYTLTTKILRSVSAAKIAIESLDLITIAVPPALPAAMTVGRYYAQKRLERNDIYCISPRSINVSGSIDCVCFDKTGTLTEDGLDMWGVVPITTTNQFQMPLKQIDRLPGHHLLYGMVTCHSITIMNGIMKGDPLDLKMFESTGWILEEANVADDNKYDLLFPTIVRRPKSVSIDNKKINKTTNSINDLTNIDYNNKNIASTSNINDDDNKSIKLLSSVEDLYNTNSNDIGIVREFSFTSTLQRMSVITRLLSDNHFNVYCKGSPEMIQTLCKSSTIPDNYLQQLNIYAQQGYRIIAIAYKSLDKKITYSRIQRMGRDKVECDLEFQGFVILENRLKPDTTDVIKSLTKANIRTVMVTGDNILTALSVAKDCKMIKKNQYVITVNTRQHINDIGKYELYYNLIGIPQQQQKNLITNHKIHNNNDVDAAGDDDDNNTITTTTTTTATTINNNNNNSDIYSIMTNSNSIDSLETIDTWTHRDIESGITSPTSIIKPSIIDNHNTANHINHYNNNNNNQKLSLRKRFFNYYQKSPKKKSKLINNNNYKKNDDDDDDDDDDNDKNDINDQLNINLLHNNYRFAMIGKTWSIIREHFPELLDKFCTRGTIFARMSPDQKQSLILQLQDLGYYVAMCGDGANDCGALKAAHTGISLSEAESSVASPFTSKKPTISCVINVIKEGRAALITSFGIFKYMAAYSLVQFISVLILYSIDSNLTDIQFLYIDLGLISIFAFFFGKTESYNGPLVKYPPLNSLITYSPIISLLLQLILCITIQVISWYHLKLQNWYIPFDLLKSTILTNNTINNSTTTDGILLHNFNNNSISISSSSSDIENLSCYENYTIFIITCYQYIILAFVYSKGKPYRKSIISNIPFLLSLLLNLIIVIYLNINPAKFLINWFELIIPPEIQFSYILFIYGIINFIISLFIELYIIDYIIFYKFNNIINKNKLKLQRYININNELNININWPYITTINNDIINDLKYINDKSSPISYAEISAEQNLNYKTPENCILNNFFDTKHDNNNDNNDDEQQYQNHNNNNNVNVNDDDNLINNKKSIINISNNNNNNNNTASTSGDNLLNNNNKNKIVNDTIVDDDDNDDNDDEKFNYNLTNSDEHSELSDYESAKNELLNDSQLNLNNNNNKTATKQTKSLSSSIISVITSSSLASSQIIKNDNDDDDDDDDDNDIYLPTISNNSINNIDNQSNNSHKQYQNNDNYHDDDDDDDKNTAISIFINDNNNDKHLYNNKKNILNDNKQLIIIKENNADDDDINCIKNDDKKNNIEMKIKSIILNTSSPSISTSINDNNDSSFSINNDLNNKKHHNNDKNLCNCKNNDIDGDVVVVVDDNNYKINNINSNIIKNCNNCCINSKINDINEKLS